MRTTPSDLEFILHCYYSAERHPRHDVPAIQSAIREFLAEGLIQAVMTVQHKTNPYETTERGRAWVEMICATPYPEQAWRNPVTKEVIEKT